MSTKAVSKNKTVKEVFCLAALEPPTARDLERGQDGKDGRRAVDFPAWRLDFLLQGLVGTGLCIWDSLWMRPGLIGTTPPLWGRIVECGRGRRERGSVLVEKRPPGAGRRTD